MILGHLRIERYLNTGGPAWGGADPTPRTRPAPVDGMAAIGRMLPASLNLLCAMRCAARRRVMI